VGTHGLGRRPLFCMLQTSRQVTSVMSGIPPGRSVQGTWTTICWLANQDGYRDDSPVCKSPAVPSSLRDGVCSGRRTNRRTNCLGIWRR
jgi:hypothetical protein